MKIPKTVVTACNKYDCTTYCCIDFHSLLQSFMWTQQEQSMQSLLNPKFSQTRLWVRPYEKLTSVRITGQQHHWSLSIQNFHSDSYTLRKHLFMHTAVCLDLTPCILTDIFGTRLCMVPQVGHFGK